MWIAAFSGVIGIGCGVIYGLPLGLLIGHTDKYVFQQFIDIEVSSITDKSNNFVSVEWNGKKIDLPRSKIKQIDKSEDKIIITLPLNFYKEVFD